MIRAVDNASVLALAHYANEKLAPLVEQLTGGSLAIDMQLGYRYFEGVGCQWSVSLDVRDNQAANVHGDKVAYGNLLTDSDDVDYVVQQVAARIAGQRLAA